MKPPLSTSNCIPLDPADALRAQSAVASLERTTNDPRCERFRSLGICTVSGCRIEQPENGKLIFNDGNEVDNDIWRRLSLDARKPVRALDVEPVVSCLHCR